MKRRASGRQGVGASARRNGRRSDWRAGFTLLEVVVAVAVFAVAILGVFGALMAASSMTEGSRNLTQAVEDARTVLERIRADLQSTTDVTTFVASHPAATYETWVQDQRTSAAGFTNLAEEAVGVTYGNPGSDPLDVTAQVTWHERGGRARSTSLQTQMTRR